MKFNTGIVVENRDKTPVKEPGVEGSITVGTLAVRAIDAQLESDKNRKPEEIRKNWMLGTRIMGGGIIDLSAEEVVYIQNRLWIFSDAVAGQVLAALEPKDEKSK